MSLRDYGLAELDLEKAIRIDPDVDYMLGDDQAFYCYPVRFPTVEFELIDTTALCVAVDIRGPFFICGLGEEDFCDISGEMALKYAEMFWMPEWFERHDGQLMVIYEDDGSKPHV